MFSHEYFFTNMYVCFESYIQQTFMGYFLLFHQTIETQLLPFYPPIYKDTERLLRTQLTLTG